MKIWEPQRRSSLWLRFVFVLSSIYFFNGNVCARVSFFSHFFNHWGNIQQSLIFTYFTISLCLLGPCWEPAKGERPAEAGWVQVKSGKRDNPKPTAEPEPAAFQPADHSGNLTVSHSVSHTEINMVQNVNCWFCCLFGFYLGHSWAFRDWYTSAPQRPAGETGTRDLPAAEEAGERGGTAAPAQQKPGSKQRI